MGVLEIILGIVLIVLAVVIVLMIMKQEGNENGVNVISGNNNSFMDKSKPMTMSDRLAKWTKWVAGIFFVLVLVAMLITNL
ncbi:MAG: preprotein translocase subunit SecG [Clostridia bacterium]|nr:preprotein translocase subunit SecG [Clostridia bacterium]